jgi:hypothetical protein
MKRLLACLLLILPMAAKAQCSGDWNLNDTVICTWNTFGGDGQSITRATDGTVAWREDGADGELTTGLTDTEDADGKTGVHKIAIVASAANGFEAGKSYSVVVSGAVVDSQTVNGGLGTFTIGKSQVAAAAALTAYDPPTNTELTTGLDALPTAAENATAWKAMTIGPRTAECWAKTVEAVLAGRYTGALPGSRTFRSPENDGVSVTGTVDATSRTGTSVSGC